MKLSSIEAIVGALNDRDVPFLVVGGLAVAAHGYGRQTRDLDLVIRLDADAIPRSRSSSRTSTALPRFNDLAPGLPVRIVRLETLLQMKRQAGRPQDLADIAELRLLHGEDDA